MAARKPPGTSWADHIESQIRRAEEEGAFDDLPGTGKPLPNLGEVSDPAWWAKNLVRREQISLLPPALELRRKVERELEKLPRLRSEAAVRAKLESLNAEIVKVNSTVTSGPSTTMTRLDVEAILERWRATSG